MKDTYYINKQYHTLVRVTYNPTKRQYNVLDYSRYEDERMSVSEFCERVEKEYEPIRRAKIVETPAGTHEIVVRSKSTKAITFKTYRTFEDAYAQAIRESLPLVTYIKGTQGTAIGLNTIRSVVVVSKYYRKDYYLLRAFDREYNR